MACCPIRVVTWTYLEVADVGKLPQRVKLRVFSDLFTVIGDGLQVPHCKGFTQYLDTEHASFINVAKATSVFKHSPLQSIQLMTDLHRSRAGCMLGGASGRWI